MSSVLRLYPEDLRATASALGGLSDDTDQAQQRLDSSWSRLDSGWEWYAEEDINGYFQRAMRELSLMAAMLEQMGQALVETANSIEAADQASVALFSGLSVEASEPGPAELGGIDYTVPLAGSTTIPGGYQTAPIILPPPDSSISEERIKNLHQFLRGTDAGRRVAEWLDKYDVKVVFGDMSGAGVIAACSPDGKQITLDVDYAYLSDIALASVLVHEGTHSLDSHPLDENAVPVAGPIFNWWYNIQDDFMYPVYPYPEEYRAFRAEAEFWLEVRNQAQPDPIMDNVVKLIFDANGGYRDPKNVYTTLHNEYGYEGLIEP